MTAPRARRRHATVRLAALTLALLGVSGPVGAAPTGAGGGVPLDDLDAAGLGAPLLVEAGTGWRAPIVGQGGAVAGFAHLRWFADADEARRALVAMGRTDAQRVPSAPAGLLERLRAATGQPVAAAAGDGAGLLLVAVHDHTLLVRHHDGDAETVATALLSAWAADCGAADPDGRDRCGRPAL